MDDVICLLSDSDTDSPPQKKAKTTLKVDECAIIDLSTDDEQNEEKPDLITNEDIEKSLTNFKIQKTNSFHSDKTSILDDDIKDTSKNVENQIKNTTTALSDIKNNFCGLPATLLMQTTAVVNKLDNKDSIKTDDNNGLLKTNVKDTNTSEVISQDPFLTVLNEEPFQPEPHAENLSHDDRENGKINSELPAPSISTEITKPKNSLPEKLITFINVGKDYLFKSASLAEQTSIEKKIKTIKKTALKASIYIQTEEFLKELELFHKAIVNDPNTTQTFYVKLYKLLKSNENPEELNGEDANEVKRTIMLDSLYEKLTKINEKVHEMEMEEVDFDAEENSSYCKCERYKEKAAEILCAIAKLEDHSPYVGMGYFSRLDFSKSNINEFNIAINKTYRNREKHTFPSFSDVNKCLRKCVKSKKLEIAESKLKTEIEFCFRELGKLLQKRRQKDLEFTQMYYITDHKKLTGMDEGLKQKLKENRKIGQEHMEAVFKKYTGKQEAGEEPDLSPDSDDSRKPDSELSAESSASADEDDNKD